MSTGNKLVLGIIVLSLFITVLTTYLLVRDMKSLAQKMQGKLGDIIVEIAQSEEQRDDDKKSTEPKRNEDSLGNRVAKITEKSGQEQVEAVANDIASRVDSAVEMMHGTAQSVADMLMTYKEFCAKNEVEPDRNYIKSLLKGILERNDKMQAIWVGFEPNQFDDNDAAFIGQEVWTDPSADREDNYVSKGQFIPWFFRNEQVKSVIEEGYLDDCYKAGTTYYTEALRTGKIHLEEPYHDGSSVVITVSIPLKFRGKTIGVFGIDLQMSDVEKIVLESHPLETGMGMLVVPSGQFVVHPRTDWVKQENKKIPISGIPGLEQTAKFLQTEQKAFYRSKTILGNRSDEEMQVVQIPVHFEFVSESWFLLVAVPLKQVMHARDEVAKEFDKVVQSMEESREESETQTKQSVKNAYLVGGAILLVSLFLGTWFASYVNKKVAEKDHWYRQILDTVSAPICVMDTEKIITYINKYAENLLNKKSEDCVGQSLISVAGPDMDSAFNQVQRSSQKAVRIALNNDIWEMYSGSILEPNGTKSGIVSFLKNVTDRENILTLAKELEEHIAETVGQIQEITADSARLSAGSEEQAASLQEITGNMNQMSEQTEKNAAGAVEASKLTSLATQSAKDAQKQMETLVKQMSEISKNSSDTRKVIKTIDAIAFQTNLLALNAAVEAARAGTHGKGFAVVAEEVRNLASRSAKAAQETEDMIKNSGAQIDTGVKTVHKTSVALNAIAEQIAKATELVASIANSSREQADGVKRINFTLTQVENVTQENSQTATRTAEVAHELNENIGELNAMMEQFK